MNVRSRHSHFSGHARERVQERLNLSFPHLRRLLDEELTIWLRNERDSDREHLLFHSVPDGVCFVAIRAVTNGTVVTVLPVEYYENLCAKIPWELLERARELVLPGPCSFYPIPLASMRCAKPKRAEVPARAPSTLCPPKASSPTTPSVPSGVTVKIYIEKAEQRIKLVNLGSWPTPLDWEPERLLDDPAFLEEIRRRRTEKAGAGLVRTLLLSRPGAGPIESFPGDVFFAAA